MSVTTKYKDNENSHAKCARIYDCFLFHFLETSKSNHMQTFSQTDNRLVQGF